MLQPNPLQTTFGAVSDEEVGLEYNFHFQPTDILQLTVSNHYDSLRGRGIEGGLR